MSECSCKSQKPLLYACSGAADLGLLADQSARKISSTGAAAMTCLAGIGAALSGFVASAQDSSKNIVIDGCPVACGAKALQANNATFQHFVLTDFGLQKGKTDVTEELVKTTAEKIMAKIRVD